MFIKLLTYLWLCRWRELKQQFDLKSHDAKLLTENLKQSDHGQQLEEINQLEATIGQQFTVDFVSVYRCSNSAYLSVTLYAKC